MDVNIYGDIVHESYNISFTALRAEISMKRKRYISTYHSEPKFIKLPYWIFKWALHFDSAYVIHIKETRDITLFGLVCYPTISIQELEDIEVF